MKYILEGMPETTGSLVCDTGIDGLCSGDLLFRVVSNAPLPTLDVGDEVSLLDTEFLSSKYGDRWIVTKRRFVFTTQMCSTIVWIKREIGT